MKAFRFLFGLLFLGVLITHGCKNDDQTHLLPEKIPSSEQEESILLDYRNFSNLISTFKLNQSYANKQYTVGQLPLDNKDFANFINEIDIDVEAPVGLEDIFTVVLLSDKTDEFDPITESNTQALCLYYLKDGFAYLSFYTKQKNKFTADPKLTSGTQGAMSSTIKYLLFHQTNTKNIPGYLVILNNEYDLTKIKWQFETISLYADEAKRIAYKDLISPRSNPCDCPVVEPPPNCHYNYQTCSYTFDDDCRDRDADYASNLVAYMTTDSVWTAHDTILHYALRDNVLANLGKGYDITNLYYYINSLMTANNINPSLSLRIRTTRLLYHMHNPIYKLVNNNSYGNDIFLTNTNANIFLGLLDEYKALGATDAWEGSIDEVKDYVNSYKGQTISFIMNNL